MRYTKTIGASVAALACVLAFGLKPAYAPVFKKDPNVVKVVETIKQTEACGYETSNKRFVSFAYNQEPYEYLALKIYKLDKNGAVIHDSHVVIKDYDLDNLDGKDIVSYITKSSHPFIYYDIPETTVFSQLSDKTQREVKNEYNTIIKEAPKELLKADEKKKQWCKQQEEQMVSELENKILNIIK